MKNLTRIFWHSAILALALFACQSEPALPEKPEEVLRQYQQHIDKNEFGQAAILSTPANKLWLSDLAGIIANEQADSTMLDTEFLSLNCTGQGDTLSCICVLRDQYEEYTADYRLVRLDGQWLVDAPEEEIIIENDIIESIPDSLLQEMLEQEMPR